MKNKPEFPLYNLVYLLNGFFLVFFFLLTNKPRPEIRIITKKKKLLYKTKKNICLTSNLHVEKCNITCGI